MAGGHGGQLADAHAYAVYKVIIFVYRSYP